VKSLHRFTICLGLLVVLGIHQSQASFTSFFVFGDGACTTTNNDFGGTSYFEKRFCNGRVWVEVLAQWQNLPFPTNHNWSYFGHSSQDLTNNVNSFTAPAEASNALVAIWVADADIVNNLNSLLFGPPYDNSKIAIWTNALNQTASNHAIAIQTLYNKGIRTLVIPNAVDLTKVPVYTDLSGPNKTFVRQRTLEFNTRLTKALSNAAATHAGLKIIQPDIFTLLNSIFSNPTNFGLIVPPLVAADNAIDQGLATLNGSGANFMFWDDLHPTAKFQMYIAEQAQQLLSPARISEIVSVNTSNQLSMAQLPVGRNGVVEVSTNFINWPTAANVTTTNSSQSILVKSPGDHGFYRLRFPFLWTWP
jgi:phospholipase/lecithinase/hemolysin